MKANKRLQRTGGQRRFAAQWSGGRLVAVPPPPLSRQAFGHKVDQRKTRMLWLKQSGR